MENYKPHPHPTDSTEISTSTKSQPKGLDFFWKNISGDLAYSERKVVDKRLGNFMVIFIYLIERNFNKKTLCGNWLIVRKIAEIFALNPFVSMIGERSGE